MRLGRGITVERAAEIADVLVQQAVRQNTTRLPRASASRSKKDCRRFVMALVCDNYGTHKGPAIRRWLEQHPRFQVHYTPTYSSWMNQVERWFAYLTDDLLRRSDHRSVQALEKDIRSWVAQWNENPKPFIWTKSAEEILAKLGQLLQRIDGAGH
jgi:transposase